MKQESTLLLLLLGVISLYLLYKPCYETFTGSYPGTTYPHIGRYSLAPALVDDEEYIKDVKNIAAYVGNYVGQIYEHLRARQFDPVSKKPSTPMWLPKSVNDIEGVPQKAKHQLDVYMKSATKFLKEKYPEKIRKASAWGIYHEMKDNNIYIYYKTDGFTRKYLV